MFCFCSIVGKGAFALPPGEMRARGSAGWGLALSFAREVPPPPFSLFPAILILTSDNGCAVQTRSSSVARVTRRILGGPRAKKATARTALRLSTAAQQKRREEGNGGNSSGTRQVGERNKMQSHTVPCKHAVHPPPVPTQQQEPSVPDKKKELSSIPQEGTGGMLLFCRNLKSSSRCRRAPRSACGDPTCAG